MLVMYGSLRLALLVALISVNSLPSLFAFCTVVYPNAGTMMVVVVVVGGGGGKRDLICGGGVVVTCDHGGYNNLTITWLLTFSTALL